MRAFVFALTTLAWVCAAENAPASADSSSRNIAVLDLVARDGITEGEALTISDRLRGELIATGKFTVLERSDMAAVLAEQGFQQSGACSDASCIVEVGQLLAVHAMVGGSIGLIGEVYSVNLKLIDVASGEIALQVAEDFECAKEELVSVHMRSMARRLAGLEAERRPLTTRWFFWVPVGAAAVGAGVAIAVLAGGDDEPDDSPESRQVTLEGSYQ